MGEFSGISVERKYTRQEQTSSYLSEAFLRRQLLGSGQEMAKEIHMVVSSLSASWLGLLQQYLRCYSGDQHYPCRRT